MHTKPIEVNPQAAGKTTISPKQLKKYEFYQVNCIIEFIYDCS